MVLCPQVQGPLRHAVGGDVFLHILTAWTMRRNEVAMVKRLSVHSAECPCVYVRQGATRDQVADISGQHIPTPPLCCVPYRFPDATRRQSRGSRAEEYDSTRNRINCLRGDVILTSCRHGRCGGVNKLAQIESWDQSCGGWRASRGPSAPDLEDTNFWSFVSGATPGRLSARGISEPSKPLRVSGTGR